MTVQQLYTRELQKIAFLKDISIYKFKYSHIVLFREYQSRLFKWKNELKFDGLDFFNKRKSYHNLFLDLSPGWLDEITPESVIINDLQQLGVPNLMLAMRHYQGYFIYLYLNWEIFKHKPEIESHKTLRHPYEPVFKLISRRGYIATSDNKFDICDVTYRKYDNSFEMPSMEHRFLDFIDDSCTSYPNQEKINQLWLDYKKI